MTSQENKEIQNKELDNDYPIEPSLLADIRDKAVAYGGYNPSATKLSNDLAVASHLFLESYGPSPKLTHFQNRENIKQLLPSE